MRKRVYSGPKRAPIEIFETHFSKGDGCWEWTGYLARTGYGWVTISGYPKTAHRVSWLLYRGKIPTGMYVCHTCDNRKCVNPEHLFLGSHADNMRDMAKKGRSASMRGTKNPRCKLSIKDVLSIYKQAHDGVDYTEISKKYGIAQQTVCAIKVGQNWSHITGAVRL